MEKRMARILGRIGWAILIGLIVLAICVIYYVGVGIKLDSGMLANAETAFNSGITVEDAKDDFVSMGTKDKTDGGKPNNPKAYAYPYLDMKSVSVGIDSEYLYAKTQFWGEIPMTRTVVNGDAIQGNGIKLIITNSAGDDQAILETGYSLTPFSFIRYTGTYYFYGPSGIMYPEDKRFLYRGSDSKASGGPGKDYIIGAFPIKNLGIAPGQMIYFTVADEAESNLYDHASADVLGGEWKMPALVIWNTSAGTYVKEDRFYARSENSQKLQ